MRPGIRWLLAALAVGSTPALASEVSVGLVSENGPLGAPVFDVTVDGVVVGGGTLSPPAGVVIRELEDIGAVAATLTFPIPEEVVVRPESVVGIRMSNDSSDSASGQDATLFVTSVSIDGAAADVSAAMINMASGEAMPIYTIGGGALIVAWNATATFTAPDGGWVVAPTAGDGAAAPTAVEAPAAGETSASEPEAPAPEAVEPVAVPEVAESTETAPAEAAAPTCTTEASVVLMDFANGESFVTNKTAQELNAFLEGLDVAQCTLEVVGYSSLGGSSEINLVVSRARAEAVLDFIKRKELGFVSETAEGGGATSQFGAAAENRRVVVTIKP